MSANPDKFSRTLDMLERTRALLDKPWGENGAADQVVLRRRAEALARHQEAGRAADCIAVLQFRLGEESYALELSAIERVLGWKAYVELPGAPPHLLGVAEMGGEILSIIDPRRLLSLEAVEPDKTGRVILIDSPPIRCGLLADGIEGIRNVALTDIQPPPVAIAGTRGRYVRGVLPDGTVILDRDKFMSAPELTIQQGA